MSPRSAIVITGASRGLGAALARGFAGPDVEMLLIGRRESDLQVTASAVRQAGGRASVAAIDVTDRDAMANVLTDFDRAHPVTLLIANAGVTAGVTENGMETPGDARRVLQTNMDGMLNTLEPVLPQMLARGDGQVALVGSIAALYPHPDQPVYSATKSAIRAYVTAMAPKLAAQGVAMSVICPGFVDTPMAAGYDGKKLWMISADTAAQKIRRGLARRQRYISFPIPLLLLVRMNSLLPQAIRDRITRLFRAEITGPP